MRFATRYLEVASAASTHDLRAPREAAAAPRADAGGGGGGDGGATAANDPCTKNAWAMAGGCRGGELRTHVLAPKSPKVAWTTALPADLPTFLGGSVVDDAGRIYFMLGGSEA